MAKPKIEKKASLGRTSWSGFLSLGLISVPIKAYRAVADPKSDKVSLNMICPTHKVKLKQEYRCGECNDAVARENIAKGYEHAPDTFVVIESDFLEKIAPDSDKTLKVLKFVPQDVIDVFFLDVPYYVVPEAAGEQAYALLLRAIEEREVVAFCKFVISGKERAAMLACQEGGLVLWTLKDPSLTKDPAPFFAGVQEIAVEKGMLEVMGKLIASKMARGFEAVDFEDARETLLIEGIQARIAGHELPAIEEKKQAPQTDLMAALMGSIG